MAYIRGRYPNRLRHYRHMAGLTIKQLAQETGIAPNTILQYELGTTDMSLFRAIDLCKVLDITVEALVAPEEEADREV